MRGRRRSKKNSAGGRRSSILLSIKKSPKALRRSARNKKMAKTIIPLTSYDSPLRHLCHNSPTPAVSKSPLKEEVTTKVVKKETADQVIREKSDDEISFSELTFDFLSTSEAKKEEKEKQDWVINIDVHTDVSNNSISDCLQPDSIKKRKRSKMTRILSGEKVQSKKTKPKKSLLSRIKDPEEESNSIILIDDSDSEKTLVKPFSNELVQSELTNESNNLVEQKIVPVQSTSVNTKAHPKLVTNFEDILVVDDDSVKNQMNESDLKEMNAVHDKFNKNESEHIIILDETCDELPDQNCNKEKPQPRQGQSFKINEDCLVVWSSLPKPSTSTESSCPLIPQSKFNSDSDILKQDKILFDTCPDPTNFKRLNNENKPKKKLMKSPRVPVKGGSKKPPFKSILEMTKVMANHTAKSAAEAAKVAEKSGTKEKTKTVTKRKAKNSEDLIFLSSSKEDKDSKKKKCKKNKLREIVIDGSNIGMVFTQSKFFSEKGIKLLIDYFTKKGHTVKVFIPQYRRSRNYPMLEEWYKDGTVVFTPSRKLGNKSFTPYDDRYILEYATACSGIIVSQDQFRDLYAEKPQYRDTIENRLLVPTFVGDYVMFPEDPLGRDGPCLAEFLRH